MDTIAYLEPRLLTLSMPMNCVKLGSVDSFHLHELWLFRWPTRINQRGCDVFNNLPGVTGSLPQPYLHGAVNAVCHKPFLPALLNTPWVVIRLTIPTFYRSLIIQGEKTRERAVLAAVTQGHARCWGCRQTRMNVIVHKRVTTLRLVHNLRRLWVAYPPWFCAPPAFSRTNTVDL